MTVQTLAEAVKLINNEIVRGVAEDIIDLNPWFALLAMDAMTGQAVTVNRENAIGDSQTLAVGGTITAKAAATFDNSASFSPTTIIGDAELNGLQVATSGSAGVDQVATEISSKAKSVGRTFQAGIATGTGSPPAINSMHSLVDSGQFTGASAGQAIGFALMDELFDLVKTKDGTVDWAQMPARTVRAYKALLRALGGTPGDWILNVPYANGRERTVITYEGTPIFKNEYLSIVETANGAALTGGALASVWAGVWDDGTRKVGVAAIYPAGTPVGIAVQPVGAMEAQDASIYRVKQYTNFAVYNRKGLARLPSINN